MHGYDKYRGVNWLSPSSIVSFTRCPRKFFYEKCGLRSREPAPALKFGEAIHAALPLAITEGLEQAFVAFEKIWEKSLEDEKRSSFRAYEMLKDFRATHSGDRSIYSLVPPPAGIIHPSESISNWEVSFGIDVGLAWPLVGRIDALCRHRDTGHLWGLEWKTSSEVSARLFENFRLSPQILSYCLVLRTLDVQIDGVMVEALRVSKTNTETSLQPIYLTDTVLTSFVKWLDYIGKQIQACEQAQNFPCQFTGCYPYAQFGTPGYACPFVNLCELEDWTELSDAFAVSDPLDNPIYRALVEQKKGE